MQNNKNLIKPTELSLCHRPNGCGCMTYTIEKNKCGKCGADKPGEACQHGDIDASIIELDHFREEKRLKHNEYNRIWANKNKPKYATYLRNWHRKRMFWFLSLKEGKCCLDCGESNSICLDYHHRDPKNKEELPQRIATSTADNSKVLKEIEKCDLICSNCHRKRHAAKLVKPFEFATFKNKHIEALYGGMNTNELKRKRHIPKSRALADFDTDVELKAKSFVLGMTDHNIRTKNLDGKVKLEQEVVANSKATRVALIGRGIIPEKLKAEEDIKKIEKRRTSEVKKISNESLEN